MLHQIKYLVMQTFQMDLDHYEHENFFEKFLWEFFSGFLIPVIRVVLV